MQPIALILAVAALAAGGIAPADAQSPATAARTANAETSSSPPARARTGQSIAVLINDEPITAYEIEQRAAFIALQGGGGGADMKAKAEARWKQIVKDPKTNERFKALLQKNNVTTQEQARKLQAQFVKDLQKNMVEQLRREARANAVAGSREKAQAELIDEKLKMQAAKRLNVVTEDADVDRILTGMAERNKMTLEQFGQHMKSMGVDISTMRNRFKAEISWREVIRRRFGYQIAITQRDVDQFVANAPQAEDQVELQLQRVILTLPEKVDQQMISQRMAEAANLAASFNGCANTRSLAGTVTGAKFEDLGVRKPSAVPEPTRTLLLNAAEGEMLPPSVGQAGIELWALCSRKVLKSEIAQRENAENELRQKEFEILAQKHLKDLRQDAAIEYR